MINVPSREGLALQLPFLSACNLFRGISLAVQASGFVLINRPRLSGALFIAPLRDDRINVGNEGGPPSGITVLRVYERREPLWASSTCTKVIGTRLWAFYVLTNYRVNVYRSGNLLQQ